MTEEQPNIVERLERLNQWQEEQKKRLEERQSKQRQILSIEQRNMYQMLGLLYPEENSGGDQANSPNQIVSDMQPDESLEACKLQISSPKTADINLKVPANSLVPKKTAAKELKSPDLQQKPKRQFLKRGQGLKQRFKIDPDELRLGNLPPYKYANAHPNLKPMVFKRPKAQPTKINELKAATNNQKPFELLDATEKRFQQLLINAETVCSSTPETTKSSLTTSHRKEPTQHTKVRYVMETEEDYLRKTQLPNSSTASSTANPLTEPITWAKVLDTKYIQPISMQQIRKPSSGNMTQDHDDSLSIFELLEQKTNDSAVNINSSAIKNILKRKASQNGLELDDISVESHLEKLTLRPVVSDVFNSSEVSSSSSENCYKDSTVYISLDEEDEQQEDEQEENEQEEDEQQEDEQQADDQERYKEAGIVTDESTLMDSNLEQNERASSSRMISKEHLHVRFAEYESTHEYDEVASTGSSVLGDESVEAKSNDIFDKFRKALILALQEQVDTTDSIAAQSEASTLDETICKDLKEKADTVKARLEELENEIALFKDNNAQLMKAKQDHELEKAFLAQTHAEEMERLKDEKVQMEIYLHDERMKLEEEKRKFKQQQRCSAVSTKLRKEVERLNQLVADMEAQLKQKDQQRIAAQQRVRVQLRNLERDKIKLQQDVEHLEKQNKKLQAENMQLSRETNNNRMLQEINKSIAKLTPKLPAKADTHPPFNSRKMSAAAKPAPVKKTVASRSLSPLKEKAVKKRCSNPQRKMSLPAADTNATSFHQHTEEEDTEEEDTDEDDRHAAATTESPNAQDASTNSRQSETTSNKNDQFKREIVNPDGSKDIWYPNGNLKKISADGMLIRMLYFNKDIKENDINEGTIKYYYAESNTWHTTYVDGLEILEFPNGQTEHRYKNGVVEVHFPDNSIKVTDPADKTKKEEWRFSNGTTLTHLRNGDKVLMLANGQKEYHTKSCKRREYPDGTVKVLYPDDSQETRYSNGRVRLKDKHGKLLMDTENAEQQPSK